MEISDVQGVTEVVSKCLRGHHLFGVIFKHTDRGEQVGHRLSHSNVRVEQEERFEIVMHRLWLFSCSHSPP